MPENLSLISSTAKQNKTSKKIYFKLLIRPNTITQNSPEEKKLSSGLIEWLKQ
jgi:hypothetical protein